MYRLLRFFIFLLPPEFAHQATMKLVNLFSKLRRVKVNASAFKLHGLLFANRIGLAAGWDKNGECIDSLFRLGFGFVEVGTVTPLPQPGNPKPRLFRITQAHALMNRMGFNNKGVDYLVERLKARTLPGVVGVNIGKNKNTPNELAYQDYLICLKKVFLYADYVVINISSPNTPGLRDLQSEAYLTQLLETLMPCRNALQEASGKQLPLFVKLSPDLCWEQISVFVALLLKYKVDGVVATNTTIDHAAVSALPHGRETGGLSGKPLEEKATQLIQYIKKIAGDRLIIIGVGGVESVADLEKKYSAGADLVQLYTGLVYQGPALIKVLAQR